MFLRSLALAASLILSGLAPSAAAPARYLLDQAASNVAFEVDFGNDRIRGRMPVASADIALDFDRPGASHISVALDVTNARTNLPFATGAMKSDTVLDASHHPQITFVSTGLRTKGANAAEVDGILTVRGVARPVTLDAQIFKRADSTANDRSALSISLSTHISRAAYGATGYPDMVGDDVRITIQASINRAN
jgi:polyisoprenoid-binding protein YceI